MSDEKRKRGRPKARDRGELLDLAMKAYWHGDPTEVSINAICHDAGISKPSLYREFGSEDGLTRAALESYTGQVLAPVLGMLDGPASFAEALGALADFAAADPVIDQGCLYTKMRGAPHSFGPQTQALIADTEAGARNAFEAFLARHRNTGVWPGPIPVELGARYLHAQLMLAMTLRGDGQPPEQIRPMLDLALSVFAANSQR